MTRIYRTRFAATGDKETLAVTDQADGKVNLPAGWTQVYELENTNPAYKPVGRREMNGIINEITDGIAELQLQGGIVTWQALDGGFDIGAIVYGADKTTMWRSTVNANTTDPDSTSSFGWVRVIDIATQTDITAGTAGKLVDAAGLKALAPIRHINTIVITSTSEYTPSDGTQFIIVEAVGGGGAGGGAYTNLATYVSMGSGGGAGGYARSRISITEITDPIDIIIGSGGLGTTATGGAGGLTVFGSFLICNGGSGGFRAGPSAGSFNTGKANGGTASGGNMLNSTGGKGHDGFSVANGFISPGLGGTSILGAGGADGYGAIPVAATGFGSGGGGASISTGIVASFNGGNGASGAVIITEFIA